MEQKDTRPQGRRKNRGRRPGGKRGYIHRSPAICVVVHDPSGRAMPDKDADAIVQSIFDIAAAKGYLINFTRT